MARSPSLLFAICALLATLFRTALAQDVDPIIIKGSKFFYKTNGTQFYIRGVAYQQDFSANSPDASSGYVDPLADPSGCARDLPYLKKLRTNTIRVYAVDPEKNHDECMTMFANAGIYVVADLGSPDVSINSNEPEWDTTIYDRYTSVIDALQSYSNVLGFFAGNEIVTQPNQTAAAPFAKAAVRDMKAYIKSKNYRPIGVGYATSDNQFIREQLANYMNCGEDQADAVDFWGYNVYSWCGQSSFQASGYAERVQEFSTYSVPVFFAEYGCNQVNGETVTRIFQETPVIYSDEMTDVFSGAIVYLYFQEENHYGLVQVDGDSVSTLPDFNNLSKQIATVSPTQVNINAYTPTNSPQPCPTPDTNWTVSAPEKLPPKPDTTLCDCMFSSLSCVVKSSVDSDSYEGLFNYICGEGDPDACNGIAANGNTSAYGPYGMCTPEQKLGYVMDQYYQDQGSGSDACDFSGSASIAQPTVASTCSTQLDLASSSVAGGVAPTTSSPANVGVSAPLGYTFGAVLLGVFVNVALVSGVGMILL